MQFGELLRLERIRAGYKSAKILVESFSSWKIEMSYSNYTRIEKGLLKPRIEFVLQIAALLRVSDFKGFLESFFRETDISPDVLTYLKSALEIKNTILQKEKRTEGAIRVHENRRYTLTVEQAQAVTQNQNIYTIFMALLLNRASISLSSLSKKTSIPMTACRGAVGELIRLKLAKEKKDPAKTFSAIHRYILFPQGFEWAMENFIKILTAKSSPLIFQRSIFLKTSRFKMQEFVERARRLALEFSTHEELEESMNDRLFAFSMQLHQTDQINFDCSSEEERSSQNVLI